MNNIFLLAIIVAIIILVIAVRGSEGFERSLSIANGFIGVGHLDTYAVSPNVYVAQSDTKKSLVFIVSNKDVKCDKLRSAKLYDYGNITIDADGVWSKGSTMQWLDTQIDTPRNAEQVPTTYYVEATTKGTVVVVRLPTQYVMYIMPNTSAGGILTSNITANVKNKFIDNAGVRVATRDVCITLPLDALYISKNNVRAIH